MVVLEGDNGDAQLLTADNKQDGKVANPLSLESIL